MNNLFLVAFSFLFISTNLLSNAFAQNTKDWEITCSKEQIPSSLYAYVPSYCMGYKSFTAQRITKGVRFTCFNKGVPTDYPRVVTCESLSDQSALQYCGTNICSQVPGFQSASLSYMDDVSNGFDNRHLYGVFYCR